ncbi:tetratricopeptide repeat protein, partial [Kaarinaea lacus]
MLEEIQFTQVSGAKAVHIQFTLPIRYITHFPSKRAKTLVVEIGFQDESRIDLSSLPLRETLLAPKSNSVHLKEVSYITEDESYRLVIQFDRDVSYKVASHDAKSLVVVLSEPIISTVQKPVSHIKAEKGFEYEFGVLKEGKEALKNNNPAKAIEIFSMLISIPQHPYTQDALELLGVARERNGQIAQAKSVYEQYLKTYPKGPGAVRVKQRIAEMIQAEITPKKKLKSSKDKTSRSIASGTFAQYYYYGQSHLQSVGSNTDQSLLVNLLSANWRKRTNTYEMSSFFYANTDFDFVDESDEDNGKVEISSLYWQLKHFKKRLYTTLGRQSGLSGGLLGRFDGIALGYDVTPKVRTNAVMGYPVDIFNKTSIQTNRPLLGLNVEFRSLWRYWDINPYFITQQYDGIVDRQAIGSEFRFFQKNKNLYAMVDYDVYYDDLNIFILRGQYYFAKSTTVNINFDYRNNPLLETANALIGLPGVEDISDIQEMFTEEEIRDLALQRTGDSTTFSIGATHLLTKDFQVNGDITYSEQFFKVDSESGDIVGEEASQNYYTIQFILNRLINARDATFVTFRQSDTNIYDEFSITLANRVPLQRKWRIDTRIRVSQREDDDGEELDKLKPSLKIDYRYSKRMDFILDFSIEWWKYGGTSDNEDYRRFF